MSEYQSEHRTGNKPPSTTNLVIFSLSMPP